MSTLATRLAGRSGLPIPREIEHAWAWMEEQGWVLKNEHGLFVTPYAGDLVRGVVFTDRATLAGWLPSEPQQAETVAADLLPIAGIAGDGSIAALWRTDGGVIRVAGLESDGAAYLLADSPVDFLRLCAIGYGEITRTQLGEVPEDEESVAAVAEFRAWVEATFDIAVPQEWPAVGPDAFTDWIDAHLGREAPAATTVPARLAAGTLTGDIAVFLNAVGEHDGAERIARHLGLPDASATSLRRSGIEVEKVRASLATVWISLPAAGERTAYPAPPRLIAQLPADAGPAQVLALLGEPERQGKGWVRYVVGGRFVHLEFAGEALARVTLMTSAP